MSLKSGVWSIVMWELKRRRYALLWWSVGSALLTGLIMGLYPSIRDQAQQLNQVINQLPPGLRELKTGGAGNVNVADPIAFLNSQIFYATLPIIWIILAITRGGSILGREEQTRTLELLLARPISRGRILFAKALSLLIEFMVVGAVTLLVILALSPVFDFNISALRLLLATAYTALFSLSFGLIAFTLQAASNLTRKAATAVAVVIGFGGYLLASLSGLTDWLTTPAKFLPYHYFNPEAVLHGQPVHGLDAYLVGLILACTVVSYLGFRRRDIN
jgi:ABC-2 type transport system permease protein